MYVQGRRKGGGGGGGEGGTDGTVLLKKIELAVASSA
jgi:hypothetical protein